MKAAKILFRLVMVVVILVLAVMVMRSIMRPEKFRNVYNERCEMIKEKLITIRDVQAVYKNENKKYFADADSLADFAANGKVSIIKNVGEIPEGMNEKDALKAGLLRKETVEISAMEKVMETDATRKPENFSNLQYVLGHDGPKFNIQTGSIASKTYEIPVYMIVVPLDDILMDMDKAITPENSSALVKFMNKIFYGGLSEETQYRSQYKDMVMGSLTEASTSGNWE
ncbi:MAG: hypothetical protein J5644_03395 [Bacteroidales bacterium]|nr:hypothetical protein [Bacteroidales bacterium]